MFTNQPNPDHLPNKVLVIHMPKKQLWPNQAVIKSFSLGFGPLTAASYIVEVRQS